MLADPAHERCGGVELLANRAPCLRTVQPLTERVAPRHREALAPQEVDPRVIGGVAARRAHQRGLDERQPRRPSAPDRPRQRRGRAPGVDPNTVPKAMDVFTPDGVAQSTELDYTLTAPNPVTIAPVVMP